MPPEWIDRFPSGEQIVQWVLQNRDPWRHDNPDRRLLRRRHCEYDVFRSIERHHVLPRIRDGFATVDAFIEYSNGVANRRKARAGRSLELHVRAIFDEHFPLQACAETVPGGKSVACSTPEALAWDSELSAVTDPSGRSVRGVHASAY